MIEENGHEEKLHFLSYRQKLRLLGLDTDDCIGEYQRMKALGVKFHSEPDVQPYGRGVMLEDLYGNRIYMNQPPEGSWSDIQKKGIFKWQHPPLL